MADRGGTFRKDLYFRLNVVTVHLPSLREHRSDIPLLAHAFLERYAAGKNIQVTPAVMKCLLQYDWPGNVRELQNAIERAAILSNGSEIDESALQLPEARPSAAQLPGGMLEEAFLWEGPLDEVSQRAVTHVERFKIQNALQESKWNKTRAAERLGVSYKTLLSKIRVLGLEN